MVHNDNVSDLKKLLGKMVKDAIISVHNVAKPKYIAVVCHR
jgi:hypothetical protein